MVRRIMILLILPVFMGAFVFPQCAFPATDDLIFSEYQFSDFCSFASASEVKEQLDKIGNVSMGLMPLMSASALNSDPGVIEILLNAYSGDVVNSPIEDGKTALMYAAELNSPEVITVLLDKGARVDIKDNTGNTALDYALKNARVANNEDILKLLGKDREVIETVTTTIEEVNERTITVDGVVVDENPPITNDQEETELVEPDEDITNEHDTPPSDNVDAEDNDKPQQDSVITTRPEDEPMPDIVMRGLPIRNEDFFKMCVGSEIEIIRNAIENRAADVNARDYYDVTPLMFAAEKNSDPEVIKVLLNAGAKTNVKDKDGKTALMYAAKSNSNPEVITALVEGGASVNARDSNRMTAIMFAARNNNASVVKALVDGGAEELADKRGWTALFWAARYTTDPGVIGILLDAGFDPQTRAHDMAMPIDHANRNKNLVNTREFIRLEEESR